MQEIRKHIDELDREIIRLFSMRSEYVHEIVKFKTDEESVIAKERKDLVIKQRGEWAEEMGLDRNTFSDLYARLLQQNISEELLLLHEKK
jgi:isochorismate pyruvate lyase